MQPAYWGFLHIFNSNTAAASHIIKHYLTQKYDLITKSVEETSIEVLVKRQYQHQLTIFHELLESFEKMPAA